MNPHTDHDIQTAFKMIREVADETIACWNKWDERIQAKQQPVPIQDLHYWNDQLVRALKVIEESYGDHLVSVGQDEGDAE